MSIINSITLRREAKRAVQDLIQATLNNEIKWSLKEPLTGPSFSYQSIHKGVSVELFCYIYTELFIGRGRGELKYKLHGRSSKQLKDAIYNQIFNPPELQRQTHTQFFN